MSENYTPKTADNLTGMTLSGAAPPPRKLRAREMGDVHPTYSGEEPSRMKSQGVPQASYTHSRDSISVPIRSWWFDTPSPSSMRRRGVSFSHKLQLLSPQSLACVLPSGSHLLSHVGPGPGRIP